MVIQVVARQVTARQVMTTQVVQDSGGKTGGGKTGGSTHMEVAMQLISVCACAQHEPPLQHKVGMRQSNLREP